MYTLELLEKLNRDMNGDYSVLYPHIKDRLDVYSDEELPFPGEFLFFEEKYVPIAIDLKKKAIEDNIVDIGCQYGFQSEFLKNYTGIDILNAQFFNNERSDVNYIVGDFMDINIDLTDKTVLSIMSLGYFNKSISKELTEFEVNELIAEKLSKSKRLYLSTTDELHALIEKKFKSKTLIYDSNTHLFRNNKKVEYQNVGKFSVYLYE